LKPTVIIVASIHHTRFGEERMASVLALVVGPTCQPEEKEGKVPVQERREMGHGPVSAVG
jgi:hypothetical protein